MTDNTSGSIVVMINFARSGGTLLNQCLGSLPNVVILSEVNPLGGGWGKEQNASFTTVRQQAHYWYQIDLHTDEFSTSIVELFDICKISNRHLVIRDWSFVDFMPYENNRWIPPNRFLTLESLQRVDTIPFAFIRDGIDVWISMGCPPAKSFFEAYGNYGRALLNLGCPIFKYEDFCAHPESCLRDICNLTGLEYSISFKSYASFENVNGDVQIKNGSRGINQAEIRLLPRKLIQEEKIAEINHCDGMIKINDLLGYPTRYDSRNMLTRIMARSWHKIMQRLLARPDHASPGLFL